MQEIETFLQNLISYLCAIRKHLLSRRPFFVSNLTVMIKLIINWKY